MASETLGVTELRCMACGFEAAPGEEWLRVDHPPLGTLTKCPECGSTDIHSAAM